LLSFPCLPEDNTEDVSCYRSRVFRKIIRKTCLAIVPVSSGIARHVFLSSRDSRHGNDSKTRLPIVGKTCLAIVPGNDSKTRLPIDDRKTRER